MLELQRKLATTLRKRGVRIDVTDRNTVLFRNVPTNEQFFNKDCTNLLVKRPQQGMPFLVCVDEDLEYSGTDTALTRIFAGGVRRRGWRALYLGDSSRCDLQAVLESALATLGFDGREPALPPGGPAGNTAGDGGLLAGFGTNLSRQVRDRTAEPTVGRAEEIDEVVSCLLRWGQARLAVIVGESGVGKTNLLHAVARKLSDCRPTLGLVSLDLESLLAGTLFDAERENLLATLLTEAGASPETILAMEHIELALSSPHAALLLARSLDRGLRLIGTVLPETFGRFQRHPLARRVHAVPLPEPTPAETAAILLALRQPIADHHRIEIADSCVQACVKVAATLEGSFPAKAIDLLDAAAARSSLSAAGVLSLDDIYFAASRQWSDGNIPPAE